VYTFYQRRVAEAAEVAFNHSPCIQILDDWKGLEFHRLFGHANLVFITRSAVPAGSRRGQCFVQVIGRDKVSAGFLKIPEAYQRMAQESFRPSIWSRQHLGVGIGAVKIEFSGEIVVLRIPGEEHARRD